MLKMSIARMWENISNEQAVKMILTFKNYEFIKSIKFADGFYGGNDDYYKAECSIDNIPDEWMKYHPNENWYGIFEWQKRWKKEEKEKEEK